MGTTRRTILTGLLILAAWAAPAPAVVLHPASPPLPASLRPNDGMIGRWGLNASCVAIGADLVLTTIHQDDGDPFSPRTVEIDGVSYTATVQSDHVGGGTTPWTEIRLARLTLDGEPADLAYWADLFTAADGSVDGRLVAIGGYGKGRGQALATATGQVYGYRWASSGNNTLRWGQNVTALTTEDVVGCLFDGPDVDPTVVSEATVADYDSGGGWFTQVNGRWRLLGLTLGTQHATIKQSWFATTDSAAPNPDWLSALRIDVYAPWIEEMAKSLAPQPGDADRDGDVDFDDLVALASHYGAAAGAGWSKGNFDGDGDVDLADLGLMASSYGLGSPVALDFQADLEAAWSVPEPSALALLAAGGACLRRRRASFRAVRR